MYPPKMQNNMPGSGLNQMGMIHPGDNPMQVPNMYVNAPNQQPNFPMSHPGNQTYMQPQYPMSKNMN